MRSFFRRGSGAGAGGSVAGRPDRRIRWLALGYAILLLAAAPQAFAQPFQCIDGDFYQIRGGGGTTTVVSTINRGVVPYTLDALYSTTPLLNALGYNPNDDYLYAISSASPRRLYRLGASGVELSGITIEGIPTGSTMDAGTFDLAGNYFVALNNGSVFRIDGVEGASPSPVAVPVTRQADPSPPAGYTGTSSGHLLVGDWAVNPLESTLTRTVIYGVRSAEGGTIYLYRVEMDDPGGADPVAQVSRIPTTGLETGNAFGTVYMDTAGSLYAYKNDASSSSGFYAVNVTTGVGTAVSGSASTNQSDGAICPLAPAQISPTLVLYKATIGGAGGPFGFTLTNTGQATGAVTTTAAGTPVQLDGDPANPGLQPFTVSAFNTAVTIRESSLPAGWSLDDAVCESAGGPVGAFDEATATYTIPAAEVVSGATFSCTFSNEFRAADLRIDKSVTPELAGPGTQVTYTLVAVNDGPDAADGAQVTDPAVAGLDCISAPDLSCPADELAGGAECPATLDVSALQSVGLAIPVFPMGGQVTLVMTCTVE